MEAGGAEPRQAVRSRRYMSKSQRACDFCRERKSACRVENGLPCQLCSYYKRECTFSSGSAVKRRRVPTNPTAIGPVQGPASPEPTVNNPTQRTDGSRAQFSPDASMAFVADPYNVEESFPPFDSGEYPFLSNESITVNQQSNTGPAPHEYNGDVDPFAGWLQAPQQPMDGVAFAENPDESSKTIISEGRYCGLTGDMDPYLLRLYRYDQNSTLPFKKSTVRSIDAGVFPIQFLERAAGQTSATDAAVSEERAELDTIVPPVVGERLISLFEQFLTHQLFVIPFGNSLCPKTSSLPLLAAVYHVAQSFTAFDDYLCIQTVYDPPPLEDLWNFVMKFIHRKDRQSSISMLQAMLVLAASPPHDPLVPAFENRQSLLYDANVMAQALGLYHDASMWPIPAHEKRLRKGLIWTLRMLESWTAAVSGRQSCILEDDWLVLDLVPEDFSASEIESGRANSTMEMAGLTEILREVNRNLFSLKAARALSQDFRQSMRTAQPLMEKLNDWHARSTLLVTDPSSMQVDNSGPLLLGYHYTRTLIMRSIYRPFCSINASSALDVVDPEMMEAHSHYRTAAKNAANKFTEFARGITDKQVCAFWPFWCTGAWATMCHLWLLLQSTAALDTELEECRVGLNESRSLLRLRASSFPVLQFALLRINSTFWKGIGDVIDSTRS